MASLRSEVALTLELYMANKQGCCDLPHAPLNWRWTNQSNRPSSTRPVPMPVPKPAVSRAAPSPLAARGPCVAGMPDMALAFPTAAYMSHWPFRTSPHFPIQGEARLNPKAHSTRGTGAARACAYVNALASIPRAQRPTSRCRTAHYSY